MIGKAIQVYEFGSFRLIPQERQLLREGRQVALTPKAFDLLLVLVEQSGHLVEKEELMKEVWPDSFVEEANLSVKMTALRRALGERPNDRQYIETVPKRGYRFVASVKEVGDNAVETLEQQQARPSTIAENEAPAQDQSRVPAFIEELATASVGHAVTDSEAKHRSRLTSRPALALYGLTVLVVAAAIYAFLFRRAPATSRPEIRSLAVLPLDNLSGDVTQEYFADGMTDALITELSKISALRVISRTSVMQYKGARKALPEIARELNVDAVVSGSVTRSGDRIRITAQLIYAATDQHLWAEDYERELRDVLSLQREVARRIADEIKVKLTPEEQVHLAAARPVNPEAFEQYLRGLYYENRFSNEQQEKPLRTSVEYFEQATGLDGSFAPAYARLSHVYRELGRLGYPEHFAKSREAAQRSVQLDDALAEAHLALASARDFEWNWADAEREYKRAIELNPNLAFAHAGYANYLTAAGQYEEALAENKRAEELDPLTLWIKQNRGFFHYCARNYDLAIEQARKTLDLSPNAPWLHDNLAGAYVGKGMYEDAFIEIRKALELSGNYPKYKLTLAWAFAMSGKGSEAFKILDEFKEPAKRKFLTAESQAEIHAALGEKQQALEWLEKSYQEHETNFPLIRCYREYDSLRSEPKFQDLLRRMGLPQ